MSLTAYLAEEGEGRAGVRRAPGEQEVPDNILGDASGARGEPAGASMTAG